VSVIGEKALAVPLRRGASGDFALADSDDEALRSKVIQVLGTACASAHGGGGELPWRGDFGCSVHVLRHSRNDVITGELARVYVRDAFRRWIPEADLIDLEVEQTGPALIISVEFRARASGSQQRVTAAD
jgi:hypothetical protein